MKPNPKIFVDAAQLIAKHGWIKGEYGNEKKGFCMAGAIYQAACDPDRCIEGKGANDMVNEAFGVDLYLRHNIRITAFNDEEDTTKEDVITFLLLAAEAAKGQ